MGQMVFDCLRETSRLEHSSQKYLSVWNSSVRGGHQKEKRLLLIVCVWLWELSRPWPLENRSHPTSITGTTLVSHSLIFSIFLLFLDWGNHKGTFLFLLEFIQGQSFLLQLGLLVQISQELGTDSLFCFISFILYCFQRAIYITGWTIYIISFVINLKVHRSIQIV